MDIKYMIFLAPFCIFAAATDYDYGKVLELSLFFYDAQRSGRLPANNRVPWRGDSAVDDSGQNGEDLSGGFYDAGDFVKFGFTMTSTVTILSWGLLSYKDAYIAARQYENCLSVVRWAADYFIKCHVSPNEFYGQVGEFSTDHAFWGRPEDLNMTRPAFKIDEEHPGSDLAGEAAAALSAVSLLYQNNDPEYAELCLNHSKELYNFAVNYQGFFHNALTGAAQYYQSSGYGDELAWAATWLYKASGDRSYLSAAERHYVHYKLNERPNEFFYNKKVAGVQVLLAEQTKDEKYLIAAEEFCNFSANSQTMTPKGLIFIDKFGTLCHAANIAFVCLQLAGLKKSVETTYLDLAKKQIDYMLGDSGRSYVVGFGKDYPIYPHHAASSCKSQPDPCGWDAFSSPLPNPQILYGALVSGPDENDYYEDKRPEYVYNEVTFDYNGGFQSAVAGLLHWKLGENV